jgi:hypothetical protein
LIAAPGNGYPANPMRPPGSYKIASRQRAFDAFLDPRARGARRVRRIVESLRDQIAGGGEEAGLRIRRIFSTPREIFRVELEVPELGYQRTTLLDREALEELLTAEAVRARVRLG